MGGWVRINSPSSEKMTMRVVSRAKNHSRDTLRIFCATDQLLTVFRNFFSIRYLLLLRIFHDFSIPRRSKIKVSGRFSTVSVQILVSVSVSASFSMSLRKISRAR